MNELSHDQALIQDFLTECAELLQQMEQDLMALELNLLDDGGMTFMKGIDVIFCCNVLIYFDSASKRRVIQHFYNSLLPDSYLFLGHAETLFGINSDFQSAQFPGSGAYRKNGASRREL